MRSYIYFAIGLSLLSLNLFGFLKPPLANRNIAGVPGYDYRILSPKNAREQIAQLRESDLEPRDKIEKLVELVFKTFIHGHDRYNIKPWDNWMFWLLDKFYRFQTDNTAFLPTTDVDLLWNRAAGFCFQSSFVFVSFARDLSFKSWGLESPKHVIAVVELQNGRQEVVDADYGIFWRLTLEEIRDKLGHDGVRDELLRRGYSLERALILADIYMDLSLSWRVQTFIYTYLDQFETFMMRLSWIIPSVLIALGIMSRDRFIRC